MVLGSLLVSSFSLSDLHTILHRGCYQFASWALVQEASLFSTSWAARGVCIVFDDGHSDWCEVISPRASDLIVSGVGFLVLVDLLQGIIYHLKLAS